MAGRMAVIWTLLALCVAAQDITVSQDAFLIHTTMNSTVSSDSLTLINQGTEPVVLDSLRLLFEVLDTAGMINDALYIGFTEIRDDSRIQGTTWVLDSIGELSYRYVVDASHQVDRELLSMNGSGDSVIITHMVIGKCPWCSAVHYPAYLKGELRLFYSNGEEKTIRLYSEDLRRAEHSDESCTDYACDSSVVRQILDKNDLDTVAVESVSNVNNGRIVTLNLKYDQSLLHSLPERLAILPASIGRLSALRSLDISGHLLDSVPESIGRCTDLETLFMYKNRLSTVPDRITGCTRLRFLSLENNELVQLPDSIGKLRSLESMVISNNRLISVPESMVHLDSLRCLFISGNSICSLPVNLEEWIHSVPTNRNCTRPEPVWPDSQQCNVALMRNNASAQYGSKLQIRPVVRADDVISIEITSGDDAVRKIEVFDSKGRRMEIERLSSFPHKPQTVRLKMSAFSAGVYHVRIVSSTSGAVCRSFVVD